MNVRWAAFLLVIVARSVYFTNHYIAGIQSTNIERWTDFFIPLLTIFIHLLLLKWLPIHLYRGMVIVDFVIEVGIATYHNYFIENIDIHTILGARSEGLQVSAFILALVPKFYLFAGLILIAVQCLFAPDAKRVISSKVLAGLAMIVLPLFAFGVYKVPLYEARLTTNYTMSIKVHGYYTAVLADLISTGPIQKEEDLILEIHELQKKNPPRKTSIQLLDKRRYEDLLVVQIESLDFNLLTYEHHGRPVIPYLKSLAQKSILLKLHAFHLGASGSSGADFQFLTGMLPLTTYPTFKVISMDYSKSLPAVFGSRSARSYAFHGNTASMWGRGRAYKKMGFSRFYDPGDFPEPDTRWGISDRLFFQHSKKIITANDRRPDFNFLITLSSHGPYNFVEHNAFPGGDLASRYFNSMHYVDGALSEFFKDLKGNHLVILYGDHTANIKQDSYRSREQGKEYVPAFIFLLQEGVISKPDSISGANLLTGELDIRSLHFFVLDHFPQQ